MPLPCLVVRPQPDADASVAALHALGVAALAAPLFASEPVAWSAPPDGAFDAIVFTSPRALRHAGPSLSLYRRLPAYAVGETTAVAARGAGFAIAGTGRGGIAGLVPLLRADGRRRALRLAGEAHLPAPDPVADTIICYRVLALPMPSGLACKLSEGVVLALHSAEAAAHVARECERLAVPRARVLIAALGQRVAEAAGNGWRQVRFADMPSEPALLALCRKMCEQGQA